MGSLTISSSFFFFFFFPLVIFSFISSTKNSQLNTLGYDVNFFIYLAIAVLLVTILQSYRSLIFFFVFFRFIKKKIFDKINLISSLPISFVLSQAAIRTNDLPVREDIELVKGKFLALLDLCGIKDADIPLFDEPLRVLGTRQTLITNFGIMSKSLPDSFTPTRSRGRSARNTGNYADMLIEHLLADVSPDSESSPPSAEGRQRSMDSRLSPVSRAPRQRHRGPPSSVVFHSHPDSHTLSDHCHLTLAQLVTTNVHNRDAVLQALDEGQSHPLPPLHHTSDSRGRSSDSSQACHSSSPARDDTNLTLQNATSGSTPELPVSESSESLDIPYASLFGNDLNFDQIPDLPFGDEMPLNVRSDRLTMPLSAKDTHSPFPLRYSHSYARELQRVESIEGSNAAAQSLASNQMGTNNIIREATGDQEFFNFKDPLMVHLPNNHHKYAPSKEFIPINVNINNNYKPHLEDKNAVVSSGPDSPKPPIPPRRPLTDSKVGRLLLNSDHTQIGNLLCNEMSSNLAHLSSPRHKRSSLEPGRYECMTTGKAYLREKQRHQSDSPAKDFPHSNQISEPLSSSKRRKANDKSVLPVVHGSRPSRHVKQRLFSSPNPSTRSDDSANSAAVNPSRNERTRKKRYSPAMRRLIQQKESNILSPALPQSTSRKPFSEIYNICLNESDPLTTSSNSLTSSDVYAKSSETSPDYPLPSREEELRDRDAHYCDFTLDRQHKIDTLSPKEKLNLFKNDIKENCYTWQDPMTKEVLVRQVEGAESSPKKNPVFQVPKANTRAPRNIQLQSHQSSTRNIHLQSRQSSIQSNDQFSNVVQPAHRSSSDSRRSSSSSSSSHSSKSGHHRERRSSRSSNRGTTNSHPIASSTLIEDVLEDTDDNASSEPSIYTWTIEEEPEMCNLEKSYIRSREAKRNHRANHKPSTPRPPTSVGRDNPFSINKQFEISAMVADLDSHLNATSSGQDTVNHILKRQVLAGAPSILRKYNESEDSSGASSQQASSSSMVFNRARASIQCSSNEPSVVPDMRRLSAPSSHRTLSSSAPDLAGNSSLSITDATPDMISELSILEEREDIPGKSNSSGSSDSCTAARCRPITTHLRSKAMTSNVTVPPISAEGATMADDQPNDQANSNQDLADSILTDSPKSVDSSGIFAPYNSYNSPAESVGSHNGYSSTVSSSVSTSDYNYYHLTKPKQAFIQPMTPVRTHSDEVFSTDNTLTPKNEDTEDHLFKRPFNPAPHFSHTLQGSVTRNQGVSAIAGASTPHRPMSVRSDPLANKSPVFAVAPGVVTGPPKISDKKSIIKKLKKFSTNFYKKNQKIRTLANL